MDERAEQLVMEYQAGRYTRRQFAQKVLRLGLAASALPAVLEAAGTRCAFHPAPAAEAAAAARTVVVAFPDNITSPDPVSPIFGDVKVVNNNLNEGIVRWKTGTVTVEPGLARTWDISADGLVYTFHLRPAKFHDGACSRCRKDLQRKCFRTRPAMCLRENLTGSAPRSRMHLMQNGSERPVRTVRG